MLFEAPCYSSLVPGSSSYGTLRRPLTISRTHGFISGFFTSYTSVDLQLFVYSLDSLGRRIRRYGSSIWPSGLTIYHPSAPIFFCEATCWSIILFVLLLKYSNRSSCSFTVVLKIKFLILTLWTLALQFLLYGNALVLSYTVHLLPGTLRKCG